MSPYYEREGIAIYHGDCREILPCLASDLLVTDPPYGTAEWGGYGRRQLGLQTISGDDCETRDSLLSLWGTRDAAVFASPRAHEPPGQWTWRLVWDKGRPGLGSPWRWTHELIYVRGAWSNTPGVPSVLRFSAPPEMRAALHPHEKPVGLIKALILGHSATIVLDPFMGSGTTLVAAKQLGRAAIGIEIEERYCEIAANRLLQKRLDLPPSAPEAEQAGLY